jgi:hypothetical protein
MTAPLVGDIVFYRSSDAPTRADPAIVTAILDDGADPCVNLTVFRDAQATIQAAHVEPWGEVDPVPTAMSHGYATRAEIDAARKAREKAAEDAAKASAAKSAADTKAKAEQAAAPPPKAEPPKAPAPVQGR